MAESGRRHLCRSASRMFKEIDADVIACRSGIAPDRLRHAGLLKPEGFTHRGSTLLRNGAEDGGLLTPSRDPVRLDLCVASCNPGGHRPRVDGGGKPLRVLATHIGFGQGAAQQIQRLWSSSKAIDRCGLCYGRHHEWFLWG